MLASLSSEAQGNYEATVYGSVSGTRWRQQQATTMTYVCCMLCLRLTCLSTYNYTDITKMWRLLTTTTKNDPLLQHKQSLVSWYYFLYVVLRPPPHSSAALNSCYERWKLLWVHRLLVLGCCNDARPLYKVIKQAWFPVATRYTKQTARSRGVYETISSSGLSINSH